MTLAGVPCPASSGPTIGDNLRLVTDRLQGVIITRRPAIKLLGDHDSPSTLFYVDPPYLPSTRSALATNHAYSHEMTESDHVALAEALRRLEGMVVLSGYPSVLYNDLYAGWESVTTTTMADQAKERTEALWLNPAASAAQKQLTLEVPRA